MWTVVLPAVAVVIAIIAYFLNSNKSGPKPSQSTDKKTAKPVQKPEDKPNAASKPVAALDKKQPKKDEKKPEPKSQKEQPKAVEKPNAQPKKEQKAKVAAPVAVVAPAPAPVKEEPKKKADTKKSSKKVEPAVVASTSAPAPAPVPVAAPVESKKTKKNAQAAPAPIPVPTPAPVVVEQPKKKDAKKAAPAPVPVPVPAPVPAPVAAPSKKAAKKAEPVAPVVVAAPVVVEQPKKVKSEPIVDVEADIRKGFVVVQERKKILRRPLSLLKPIEESKPKSNKPFYKKYEKPVEEAPVQAVATTDAVVEEAEKPKKSVKKPREAVVQDPYANDADFWAPSKKAAPVAEDVVVAPVAKVDYSKKTAPARRKERIVKKTDSDVDENAGSVKQFATIRSTSGPVWVSSAPSTTVAASDDFPALGSKPKPKPKPKAQPIVEEVEPEQTQSEEEEAPIPSTSQPIGDEEEQEEDHETHKRQHVEFDYEHELAAPSDKKPRIEQEEPQLVQEEENDSTKVPICLRVTSNASESDWTMRVCGNDDALGKWDRSKAVPMSLVDGVWTVHLKIAVESDFVRYQYLWANTNNSEEYKPSQVFDLDLEHDSATTNDKFTSQ